jgi:hypothetical protein
MNEQYAVDPAAPQSVSELKLLLDLFGLSEGRFIPKLPEEWFAEAERVLDPQTDMQRKRLEVLIQDAGKRACFLRVPFHVPSRETWLEKVQELRRKQAEFGVAGLIVRSKVGGEIKALDDVLHDPGSRLPDGRAQDVEMTVAGYLKAAKPLLELSPLLCMVDPYFCFRSRLPSGTWKQQIGRRRVLTELMRQAKAAGKVEKFRVVTSDEVALDEDRGGDHFCAELGKVAREAGFEPKQVEYRTHAKSVMHVRLLLGPLGGLQFDQGFDQLGKTHRVSCLTSNEIDQLWRQYAAPPAKTLSP